MVNDIAIRAIARPEVTELCLSIARLKIADRRFVDLDITAGHDSGADVLIDKF